jgi:hypothetical protein
LEVKEPTQGPVVIIHAGKLLKKKHDSCTKRERKSKKRKENKTKQNEIKNWSKRKTIQNKT